MPFVNLPGLKGKVYVPETVCAPYQKHPCPDCFACQDCSDTRCRACRSHPECNPKGRHPAISPECRKQNE